MLVFVALLCVVLLAQASAFMPTSRFALKVQTQTSLNAVKLIVNDEEPIENIVKKFKRACNQSGHLNDLRNKEQWETAADKKKRKFEKSRLMNRIERTNDKYENRSFGTAEYNS
ncbi:hypothetical protein B484DRAFT_447592 [Ochromonadaceae sp. CCMP2298]|nr:hypothetical protein B484DRAFT_447592 [Ochromonadaceae sp. CCMP2298]